MQGVTGALYAWKYKQGVTGALPHGNTSKTLRALCPHGNSGRLPRFGTASAALVVERLRRMGADMYGRGFGRRAGLKLSRREMEIEMPIDRYGLVSRHNPVLTEADVSSPLSVGNGNFAYTADITGMQTLYAAYEKVLPLCTMAQWGWHTTPVSAKRYAYSPDDVEMTEYPYRGRTVRYAVEKKKGNEQVYDWLRQNPHKFNLARIGLVFGGAQIAPERITKIRQELKLYEGILDSRFALDGEDCHIVTAAAGERDAVGFAIRSELLGRGLAVEIAFPYGSPDITASDWEKEEAHVTEILRAAQQAAPQLRKKEEAHVTEVLWSAPPAAPQPCEKEEAHVTEVLRSAPPVTPQPQEKEGVHVTENLRADENVVVLRRTLDRDVYEVTVCLEGAVMQPAGRHRFLVTAEEGRSTISLTAEFRRMEPLPPAADEAGDRTEEYMPGRNGHMPLGWKPDLRGSEPLTAEEVFSASRAYFRDFWEKGGVIDLHRSRDSRAPELERRIVLSQYLLAIQSVGSIPPAETGLTCNSWYGKAHLEMYFWHEACLPLWNHTELLMRSLDWYLAHLPEARRNAARNGFRGARWPKMVADDALDSPSKIATLLVWQQPHIIYMLEMAYRNLLRREENAAKQLSEAAGAMQMEEAGSADAEEIGARRAEKFATARAEEFLEKYYPLVEETADFMADFAAYDEARGVYELLPPVIPVQENHRPMDTKNPAFEVEYWSYTLQLACRWAGRLGRPCPDAWREVAEHMAPMPAENGCYLAHDNCPDSYGEFAHDHPSMLCAFGVIDSGRTDPELMRNSLRQAEKVWDYQSLWGWDFAVMAMTAVRLGEAEHAIRLLLADTPKNTYVTSGNNFQKGRKDLPLYLPGNGSLLLAAALMTAGYPESGPLPGFPKDGQWEVEFEGIDPFPC